MQEANEKADRKIYVSPTITVIGDIEAITLAFQGGKDELDADFPCDCSALRLS
jgi:hypothetical protein